MEITIRIGLINLYGMLKEKTEGIRYQFEDRVNCMLLIMFVIVVSIMTIKSCSESSTQTDSAPGKTEAVFANDATVSDSTAIIQFK